MAKALGLFTAYTWGSLSRLDQCQDTIGYWKEPEAKSRRILARASTPFFVHFLSSTNHWLHMTSVGKLGPLGPSSDNPESSILKLHLYRQVP